MKHLFYFLTLCLLFISCSKDPEVIVLIPDNEKEETEKPTPAPDPIDPVGVTSTLPVLHSDGRWLVNDKGEHVNLHGFWQTYSPWFNGDAWNQHNWGDYNVEECLRYNQRQIDKILSCGWKVDFMRLHMDPYWSISRTRPWPTTREEYEDFDEELFKKYLDEVFVPMIEYCISKGLYVVLMPGYSAPEALKYGDEFYDVLEKLWSNISSHPKICNNLDVMFEIVNEPRSIVADGVAGNNDDAHNKELTRYMQHFVDLIRANAKNFIWVPGTGYQSQYAGYAKYKINADNYGFAVHCYPGWYGSDAEKESAELGGSWGGGFESFKAGWDAQIRPAAQIAPVMVTEMDWAPESYGKSWGKSYTGEAGGHGFGANFKWLVDDLGNASYILFTAPNDLADFNDKAYSSTTNYWNDYRACPWQIYHWYNDYAEGRVQPLSAEEIKVGGVVDGKLSMQVGNSRTIIANAVNGTKISPVMTGTELSVDDESVVSIDGNKLVALKSGKTRLVVKALGAEAQVEVVVEAFNPFSFDNLDPNIWETGSFDKQTHILITGQYGFGGWKYSPGINITSFSRLVCELGDATDNTCQPSFRIFDGGGYWDGAIEVGFKNNKAVIEISDDMVKANGKSLDPTNITIVGIWTLGGRPVEIKSVYFE